MRRNVLAVPFLGKDVPSPASEFADPETLICLTTLAFHHEGLRLPDAIKIIVALKRQLLYEQGKFCERPSWLMFSAWFGCALASDASKQRVLPLDLIQPQDPGHVYAFWDACRFLPRVIDFYLCSHVFPSGTATQPMKLSTSGHDLGSSSLLGLRLGFTGTPNDLVPEDLRVSYEAGSLETTLRTLTSPNHVSCSVLSQWNVFRLLLCVACAFNGSDSRRSLYSALIDVGGLVTGLSNKAVAAALLNLGLLVDGVVFFDEHDTAQVLLRTEDEGPARVTTPAVRPPESMRDLLQSSLFCALVESRTVPLARCSVA